MLEDGHRIVIPEICDYELRRELVRADKQEGLKRLDALASALVYLPLEGPFGTQRRKTLVTQCKAPF